MQLPRGLIWIKEHQPLTTANFACKESSRRVTCKAKRFTNPTSTLQNADNYRSLSKPIINDEKLLIKSENYNCGDGWVHKICSSFICEDMPCAYLCGTLIYIGTYGPEHGGGVNHRPHCGAGPTNKHWWFLPWTEKNHHIDSGSLHEARKAISQTVFAKKLLGSVFSKHISYSEFKVTFYKWHVPLLIN